MFQTNKNVLLDLMHSKLETFIFKYMQNCVDIINNYFLIFVFQFTLSQTNKNNTKILFFFDIWIYDFTQHNLIATKVILKSLNAAHTHTFIYERF